MSVVDRRALAPPALSGKRWVAALAGLALTGSTALLLWRLAPGAPAIVPIALAGLSGLSAGGLALALDEESLSNLAQGVLAGAGLIVLGAFAEPEARLRLFSFASPAFGVGLVLWLTSARKRRRLSFALAALYTAALAGLCAYAATLVLVSRDLMIADFMTYRGISMMIARLADAGEWPLLASAATQSITQDYAWGPALVPGLALALTQPTSRAVYTFALLALYAAPALLALAILARDLARRAGLRRLPSPQPSPVNGRGGDSLLPFTGEGGPKGWMREAKEGSLPFAVAATFFAYPAAMAVAARGMPDVGGLVLTVCALRLAERLARLLALGQGHDGRIAPMTRRVALALALTLFAMFAFRRWYALAAAGIAITLAIEVGSVAFSRRARFRWKDAVGGGRARGSHAARALKPGDRRLAAEPRRA